MVKTFYVYLVNYVGMDSSLLGYDEDFICVVSVVPKLNKTLDMMESLGFWHWQL